MGLPPFLLYAAVALAVWYGAVLLLCYRRELSAFVSGTGGPGRDGYQEPGLFEEEQEDDFEEHLLGEPVEEYGMSTVSSSELFFAPRGVKSRVSEEELLLGTVPDVLEEIRAVLDAVERDGGDRLDFMRLFRRVAARYPVLRGSRHVPVINGWIREQCSWPMSDEDLASLWEV